VIKITGNPNTYENLSEHLDIFVELGEQGVIQAGKALYREILEVASGKKTKAEAIGYGRFPNIFTIGPVV